MSDSEDEDSRAPTFAKFPELPKEIRLMIWEAALPSGRIVEILQRPLQMRVGEWNWPGAPENPSEQDRVDYLTEEMPADQGYVGRTSTRIQRMLGYFSLEEVDILVPEGYYFEPPSDGDFYIENNLDLPMPGIMSPCPPPSVLFVCRESYEIASEVYKKIFATHAAFAETYFSPRRDTLYLKYDTFSYITLRVFHNALCPLDSITDVDSLKSVESLAILADPDCGTLDYHLDGRRNNFTDFVDDVLSIFRNLKDFTVVLRHFDTLFDDRPDAEPYIFMDPVDVGELSEKYSNILMKQRSPEEGLPVALKFPLRRVRVNLEELELRRSVLLINGQEPWKIPRIHYKVSISPSFKSHLECLRQCCEHIKERGKIDTEID
jgi:hypothetical protein